MKTYLFKVEIAFPNDPGRANEWYATSIRRVLLSECLVDLYNELDYKYKGNIVSAYIREIHIEAR